MFVLEDNAIRVDTVAAMVRGGGAEPKIRVRRCLDIGEHFAVHPTVNAATWTVTHKPTGYSLLTGAHTVFDAIDAAQAMYVACRIAELDMSISDPAALTSQPAWPTFAAELPTIRATYNRPAYQEPAPHHPRRTS